MHAMCAPGKTRNRSRDRAHRAIDYGFLSRAALGRDDRAFAARDAATRVTSRRSDARARGVASNRPIDPRRRDGARRARDDATVDGRDADEAATTTTTRDDDDDDAGSRDAGAR
jgi:hypothetical protein